MAVKTVYRDTTIVIDIDTWTAGRNFYYGKTDAEKHRLEAERVKTEIRRHVNDPGCIRVVQNYNKVCEYCGNDWTEDDDIYNGCCDKDLEEAKSKGLGDLI